MSEGSEHAEPAPTAEREKRRRKTQRPPPLARAERLRRMALVILGGVLTFLSFPFTTERDSNLWPLAWFALVPFLEALRGLTGKQAFWFGALGGFVTNLGGFWWISEVLRDFGHLPFYVYWPLTFLNAFYQGLMYALVGLFVARAAKARTRPGGPDAGRPDGLVPIWQTAAIFTVVEWLFPMIFPWYLANGQYRFLPAIQIAELGGVMCITFMMVAFNAALHRLFVHRQDVRAGRAAILPRRALITTFLGTALALIYGQVRVAMVDAEVAAADKVKLGLVEADIGIFEKQAKHLPPREQALTLHRNLLKHQTMSAELERQGVDLVVWPESSFFPLDDPFIKRSDRMALGVGKGGALFEDVYDPAADDFVWRPVSGAPPGAQAVAALREDLFAVLGRDAVVTEVAGERLMSALPGGEARALALAPAPGFARSEDGARAVAWVAGRAKDGAGLVAFGRPGEALTALEVAGPRPLSAIAMRNGRDGVAVGQGGVVVEIEREQARVVGDSLTSKDLAAVAWGDVPGLGQVALAVGAAGTVLVRLPDGWQADGVRVDVDLSAVAFDRRGDPWIGGGGGYVAVRSGGTWHEAPLPEARDVTSLAVDPLGTVLVADAGGGFWARAEGATTWSPRTAAGAPLVSIASADWVQVPPLPRDFRWLRQATAPLPALADFDADPGGELGGVREADRTAIQRGFRTPLLFGGLTWAPPLPGKDRRQLYNTAIMLDRRGRLIGTYDKVYLLAFGEYMPFGETFPGLYDMFPQAGRFTPGNEVRTFTWRGHRLGIMICYEDIMVDFTGRLADLDPNIIINVTNDAWFGKTSEPWLHLALSVFRAVENRVSLVRSTNTGISAFIEPTGRLVGATRLEDAETLVADVPMMDSTTVYGTIGNVFASLLAIILAAQAAIRWHLARAGTEAEGKT